MKQSDIEAIERVLFQYYDDKFSDGFLYLTEDDISDIEQIFGSNDNWGEPVSMECDFSIEEILDMPTEDGGQTESTLTKIDCIKPDYIEADNESHGECNHELFGVTEKGLDLIDIDSIFDNGKMII